MSRLRQAICRAQEFFAEQLAEFTYHKGNKLTKAHVVHLGCIKHLLDFDVSLLGLCLGSWDLFGIGLFLLGLDVSLFELRFGSLGPVRP
uniref:Uncharacterized protein n=1 Tax=Fagus sylvatica TaxID=28930 RepID=A0A2N9GE66_FAGSY